MSRLQSTLNKIRALAAPPPRVNVREWAESNLYLPRSTTSLSGRFRPLPWQREPLEALTDPSIAEHVWEWGAQLGKTTGILAAVGYFIEVSPSPILLKYPAKASAESFSKEKLAPTLDESPSLKALVAAEKSRQSDNTILYKKFRGGFIALIGANSATELRRRSCRVVVQDEIDADEGSAQGEGDPVSLADKRAETFGDALFLKVSTPKLKGFSRIEKLMEQTDARHWFVPCPKCGFFQTLKWENIHWVENQPETAWLECEHCKQRLSDAERIQAVVHGEWRPTLPFRGKRGYFLNGFNRIIGLKAHHQSYLHEFVDEYLTARKDDQTYQVWVNTVKTEAYEQRVERVEHHSLFERRENYGPDIPAEVCVLTAGVDIQNNRIEAELVGWGVGEESWSLDYRVFPGDVETDAPWAALDAWLLLPRFNVHRQPMRVLATGVDTDASTQQAYKFCRARWARHVCALKGKGGPGLPLVALPRRSGVTKVKLYTVGSDTAKAIVYSRLAVAVPGKGYCHFPMQAPEEYFRQLTSEVIVVKRQSGRMWRAFQLPTGARNEALDCRCYALAAVHICQPNLEIIKVRLSKAAPPAPQEPQPEATEKPVPESPKVPQVPPAPVQPAGARTRKARPPRSPSWLGGTFQSWKL